MRRIQIQRITYRKRARLGEPLPLDPRDPDVVRAKQLAHKRDRTGRKGL